MVASAVVPAARHSFSSRSPSAARRLGVPDPGLSPAGGRTLKAHDEEFRTFLEMWRRYHGWADIAEQIAEGISLDVHQGGGWRRAMAQVHPNALRKGLLMMCIVDLPSVVAQGMITSLDTMAIIAALLLTLIVPLMSPDYPEAVERWGEDHEPVFDVARHAFYACAYLSMTFFLICVVLDMHIRNLLALAYTRESDIMLAALHQSKAVMAVSVCLVMGVLLFSIVVAAAAYAAVGPVACVIVLTTCFLPWAPAIPWFENSSRLHQVHKSFAYGRERGRTVEQHLACLQAFIEGERLLALEYRERFPTFFPSETLGEDKGGGKEGAE